MKSNSIKFFFIWPVLLAALAGCATPGHKFITINALHVPPSEGSVSGHIGIAPFQDRRHGVDKGYIGYRILLDNTRETYFVRKMNLARALTDVFTAYYTDKGFTVSMTEPWALNPDTVKKASDGFDMIFTGIINKFECRAQKKGPATAMTLDIDLTFFLGIPGRNILKTIPASLTLERTELIFTPEKLDRFINTSLAEIIQKALNQ
jgi:hypothetical protein